MEKEGVQPDVMVETNPDQLSKGIDAQLDRAVEVVEKDVVAAGWYFTAAGRPEVRRLTPAGNSTRKPKLS
jgi:hypothetical protein